MAKIVKTKKTGVKKKTALPRGYKLRTIEKELNLPTGPALYRLVEVSGSKVPTPKLFVNEVFAMRFIERAEKQIAEVKALAGRSHAPVGMSSVVKQTEELKSLKELAELSDYGKKSDRAAAKVMYSDSE